MSQQPADKPSDEAHPFGSLKIVPVEPGHEHEPDELEANIDIKRGVVYVRAEDWPKLKAELANLPTRQ